jgi:hypothetical protein
MNQNNSREEFATQLSKSVRYSSGRGQYDAFPDCQDAYLDGVETAVAMMYIDLTGGHKSEGMLAKFLHQELQKAREQRKGWKGYVVVDPQADNYKYSPIYMDRREATLWLAENGDDDLEVIEVDIVLSAKHEK